MKKFLYTQLNTSSSVPDYASFVTWSLDFSEIARYKDAIKVFVNGTKMFECTIDYQRLSEAQLNEGYFSKAAADILQIIAGKKSMSKHQRWELRSYLVFDIYGQQSNTNTVLDSINVVIDKLQTIMVAQ